MFSHGTKLIAQLFIKSFYLSNTLPLTYMLVKVRKGARIRNRYQQVPHLTQDTTWERVKGVPDSSALHAYRSFVEVNHAIYFL